MSTATREQVSAPIDLRLLAKVVGLTLEPLVESGSLPCGTGLVVLVTEGRELNVSVETEKQLLTLLDATRRRDGGS